MFSMWRKLTGKQDGKPIFPTGVVPIGESMQKKYAKGVQYNMKIIIKGDRNTGKSALFQRLNGQGFKEEYLPTHEIQVTNVNWNYQGAADVVKVEVWDIVDKSEKKKVAAPDSLKIANNDEEVEEPETSNGMALDAEFLNVFKGTHGVILTMDITKAWTWTYVQRELEIIPHRIPVLVLGNFRDMGDRRVVQTDEIVAHIEHLDRPTGSAEVYFTESSMKDGFGLRFAYKYLNMPFLILQRETLLKQLEANTLEIEETRETLSIHAMYEDGNYLNFKELLAKKDNMLTDDSKPEDNNVVTTPDTESQTENIPPVDTTVSNLQPLPPLAKLEVSGKSLPVATVSPTVHSVDTQKESIFKTYTKKFFGGENSADNRSNGPPNDGTAEQDGNEVGDFDTGQLSSDFLDNSNKSSKQIEKNKVEHESDDDSENGNPMVANYADLDSDEEIKTFEEQFSNEGEFEDLSDDERHQLEQPNVSIIEKIKSERASNNTPDRLHKNGDYNDLDSDINDMNNGVNNEQCDIDSDSYSIQTIESIPPNMDNIASNIDILAPDIDIIDNIGVKKDVINNDTSNIDTINNSGCHVNNVNNTEKTVVSDDDEEDDTEQVYIISGDIDVDDNDAWLVEECSDHETKTRPSTSSKHESFDVPTSSSNSQSALNFELDELEMFMKNQLEKTPSIVEQVDPEPVIEPSPSDDSRPKKKKKKKKKTNSEEPVVNAEKKKKKKAVNTEEVSEKPTTATTTTTTTKKTKRSKSTSSDTKSTTSTEKEKKSKKTRKKDNSISELDSFYEGL